MNNQVSFEQDIKQLLEAMQNTDKALQSLKDTKAKLSNKNKK